MDAFQETLVEELGNKTAFTIPLLGGIPVAESVVVSWIVMAVLVINARPLPREQELIACAELAQQLDSRMERIYRETLGDQPASIDAELG